MLVAMKASATGSPSAISASTAPIIRAKASYQGIAGAAPSPLTAPGKGA